MREIKFRVWDVVEKKMINISDIVERYGFIQFPKDDTIESMGADHLMLSTNPQYYIWLQYIGLKDKNGVEGFADDIVKAGKDELFKIEWFEDTASWVLTGLETGKVRWIENRQQFTSDFHVDFAKCEVIGNIYENPELLK